MASIPEYSEAQKKHRYDKYWPRLFEDYFEAFPPPEPTAGDATDTESEDEAESEPPLGPAEEVSSKGAPGKRKQKEVKHKAVKRSKNVHIPYIYSAIAHLILRQRTEKFLLERKKLKEGLFASAKRYVPFIDMQCFTLT